MNQHLLSLLRYLYQVMEDNEVNLAVIGFPNNVIEIISTF